MRQRDGIEPRYPCATVRADRRLDREGHSKGAHPAKAPAHAPGSKTVARHHGSDGHSGGPRGSPPEGGRGAQPAHRQAARRPLGRRRSPDERGRGVTPREQRGAHAAARSTATPPTRRGGSAAKTGVDRIAQRARREPQTRDTALMHHVAVDNLRACFAALDGTTGPGVDGITQARDGQKLEANLQALRQKRPQRAYRPQPVRRVEIPKADGTLRPLGISGIEAKRVQEMTRRRLDAIYAPVCRGISSGVRPGRGCHEALRQRSHEVLRAPVTGMADLERAQCFDTMPHTAMLAGLAERSAAQTFLRLLARRLKAGGQPPGGVGHDELGRPQGSMVSPVSAKAVLDHVLDPWCVGGVRQYGHGDGDLLRDADDALAVVETAADARRLLRVLPRRLGTFGWRRNPQQTRLVAVGKRRAWQVLRGGGRMPTVDCRGFTHYGGAEPEWEGAPEAQTLAKAAATCRGGAPSMAPAGTQRTPTPRPLAGDRPEDARPRPLFGGDRQQPCPVPR
jgi:RNA-directed DNA polymerase